MHDNKGPGNDLIKSEHVHFKWKNLKPALFSNLDDSHANVDCLDSNPELPKVNDFFTAPFMF